MLSIGDLARHTGVSVRMLRHYDAVGLVVPERVDPHSGYRWYTPSQTGRVDSVVALKELGFTLEQCRAVLDEQVAVEDLVTMLRGRRDALARQIDADQERLAEVGRRLRSIERGLTMTNHTLEIKALPSLRLAQVGTAVNDVTEIAAVTGGLFETLTRRLAAAGIQVSGRGMRTFYGRLDSPKIDVAAAVPAGPDVGPIDGVELVELPAEETAATVIHRGPVAEIPDAWQTFDVGVSERGFTSYGVCRQIYLEASDDSTEWAVELQCPVRADDACTPPLE